MEIIDWFGTGCLAIGAVAISFFPSAGARLYPFFFFMTGHILWTYSSIVMQNYALIACNVGFLLLDIIAIVRRVTGNINTSST